MNAPTPPGDDRPKPRPSGGGLEELRPVPRRPFQRMLAVPSVSPEPLLSVPAQVLARYNARVLNPATATKLAGQELRSTVYIADRLLVSGLAEDSTRTQLSAAADELDLEFVPPLIADLRRDELVRAATAADRSDAETMFATVAQLQPVPGKAAKVDAWEVLQTFRTKVADDDAGQQHVALDHLMTAASGPDIGGSPFVMGHGIGGSPFVMGHGVGGSPFVMGHGVASSEYGVPGCGGRQPVAWTGSLPERTDFGTRRRPVVAIVDTGIGAHPWLPADVVRVEPIVLQVPVANPEITGVTLNKYEGEVDPDAGHGTFIAGLVRQQCPDADILAIRVMGGDGVVPESDLLEVLHLLALRQKAAIDNEDPANIIDVVSLSLGYYHELPADEAFDSLLLAPLRELGRLGVTVVVAAGNDSTDRPMYPAAFTVWPDGPVKVADDGCLPVVSVGALNPDSTIALFSNAGEWVSCHRTGAAVVSTYPTTVDGAEQPTSKLEVAGEDRSRATIDPDNFSGGFAVWSGTSFAAPVLAGEIAALLCAEDLSALDAECGRARGWAAVTKCVPELSP